MRLRNIIISFDLWAAITGAAAIYWILPRSVPNIWVKEIYSVGIGVLSIVFSLLIASLAVIASTSDDHFILFLEEDGLYTGIVDCYQYTLWILLTGLILALLMFGLTSFWALNEGSRQPSGLLTLFTLIGLYGLFASANAAGDSISYAKFRSRHLQSRIENLRRSTDGRASLQ